MAVGGRDIQIPRCQQRHGVPMDRQTPDARSPDGATVEIQEDNEESTQVEENEQVKN